MEKAGPLLHEVLMNHYHRVLVKAIDLLNTMGEKLMSRLQYPFADRTQVLNAEIAKSQIVVAEFEEWHERDGQQLQIEYPPKVPQDLLVGMYRKLLLQADIELQWMGILDDDNDILAHALAQNLYYQLLLLLQRGQTRSYQDFYTKEINPLLRPQEKGLDFRFRGPNEQLSKLVSLLIEKGIFDSARQEETMSLFRNENVRELSVNGDAGVFRYILDYLQAKRLIGKLPVNELARIIRYQGDKKTAGFFSKELNKLKSNTLLVEELDNLLKAILNKSP